MTPIPAAWNTASNGCVKLASRAKSPEERAHPDEVYDTLLPHARAGTESTLRGELDLTLPFTRPMAAARSSPTGQRQPVMGTNAHSMSAARSACCWPASATTTKPSCP